MKQATKDNIAGGNSSEVDMSDLVHTQRVLSSLDDGIGVGRNCHDVGCLRCVDACLGVGQSLVVQQRTYRNGKPMVVAR